MVKKEDVPALFTGLMATFAGVGVARFAYTPLLPELIRQEWFTDSAAAYLGAANLLGYLIGALSAHWISERISIRLLMRLCFLSITLSFVLCSQPGTFGWFFMWRMIAGISGAILMVTGPVTAMSAVCDDRRVNIGAFVFTGIGLGAVLSASVIPQLLKVSLSMTWLVLGVLSFCSGIIADQSIRRLPSPAEITRALSPPSMVSGKARLALYLVIAAYFLDAVGFIPHTLFWVDYLAREQSLSMIAASNQWLIFGIGAVCGALVVGPVARKTGWTRALILAFTAKALAVSIPLFSVDLVFRTTSSFIVGAMVPGIVALTSGQIAELAGADGHKRFWGIATAVFAVAQALSGQMMSVFYAAWKSYQTLFLFGFIALITGALLIIISGIVARQPQQSSKNKEVPDEIVSE